MITRDYSGGIVRNNASNIPAISNTFDLSGMDYTARGLGDSVTKTFTDLTGRAPTADETTKYLDLAKQSNNLNPVIDQIFKDHQQDIYTNHNLVASEGQYSGPYSNAEDYKFANKATESGSNAFGAQERDPDFSAVGKNATSTATYLTKMGAPAMAKLFKDVGIKDGDALANAIESKSNQLGNNQLGTNATDEQRVNLIKSFGFDDKKLSMLGDAMFQKGAGIGGEPGGTAIAGPEMDDNSNVDYKKFTDYDPAKGLVFTGGYVPPHKKQDWMGTIIKSAILGGIGFVAAPLISNVAAGALGTAGTTTGYAGALVPNTLANTIGSAGAGVLTGALGAGVSGGDVKKGALTGGLLGGISGAFGNPNITGNRLVDRAIVGAAKGGITAKASGGDLMTGIMSGGVTGAFAPAINNSFVSGIMNGAVRGAINGSKIRRA